MIAEGRMTPAGQAVIDAAQANGAWSRLDAVEALVVPDDLAAELARYPCAAERFAALPPSARRGILEWILQARRAETRRRRVEETARLTAEGRRPLERARTRRGS